MEGREELQATTAIDPHSCTVAPATPRLPARYQRANRPSSGHLHSLNNNNVIIFSSVRPPHLHTNTLTTHHTTMDPSTTVDFPSASGRNSPKPPPAKIWSVSEPPFEGYKPVDKEGFSRSNQETAIVIDNGMNAVRLHLPPCLVALLLRPT